MPKPLKDTITDAYYMPPPESAIMADGTVNWWLANGADVIPDKRHKRLYKLAVAVKRQAEQLCPRCSQGLRSCPGTCMFYGYTTTADDSNHYHNCPLYNLYDAASHISTRVSHQVLRHAHTERTAPAED